MIKIRNSIHPVFVTAKYGIFQIQTLHEIICCPANTPISGNAPALFAL